MATIKAEGRLRRSGSASGQRAATTTRTEQERTREQERYALHAKLDATPIKRVWEQYHKAPSEPVRNYLMEKFLHLVRYNAERIYTRLPNEVDIEDLMSAGLFGLMDAIDAFDLERQVKFETYCAQRIRGAILDELRSMDWVPRLVRHRTAKVEQARIRLEMQLGRTPTTEEISDRLGVPEEELKKILKDGSAVSISSLSRRCYNTDSNREVREIDVIEDTRQTNPLGEIQSKDLRELLTKGLSRAERLIVILYYYEEMTMKEIGATLDLSESRVSQMHSSILARLKAQMQHRSREFEPVG
ncbi:MAG TPA: FliA/WhiG family RNA polymerase sigma factor [Phycisphaerales bacterium]|nr:FliA/WhiG family RNA polymerase sigma factor [Phycisphaerales bacterium]